MVSSKNFSKENGKAEKENGKAEKENGGHRDEAWHQQRISYVFPSFSNAAPDGASDTRTPSKKDGPERKDGLVKSNLKASNVLGDPTLFSQVRAWLVANNKGEERLLLVLEAIRRLRYQASAGTLDDPGMHALDLYQTYLMNGAERDINLDQRLRYDVLDRIDKGQSVDEVSSFLFFILFTHCFSIYFIYHCNSLRCLFYCLDYCLSVIISIPLICIRYLWVLTL
jgi:hypothetical protein